MFSPEELEAYLKLAIKYNIKKLDMGPNNGWFEIASNQSEPDSINEALSGFLDAQECKCGHLIETEHNDTGCLKGCSIESCLPEGAVKLSGKQDT